MKLSFTTTARFTRSATVACLLAALSACDDGSDNLASTTQSFVRMNQVQYLGTHNSYHVRLREDLFQILSDVRPALAPTLDYSHAPLAEQLEAQGVRQIELDIFYDPEGGLYANRQALILVEDDTASGIPELSEPGLKVLHVQEIDYETTCYTFISCLGQVKAWSDAHRGHLPITVLIEAKDEAIEDPLNLDFAVPLPFDSAALDQVDKEIRSIFPETKLITPDLVRGERESLEQAILAEDWPLLDKVRGRIMFALDNGGTTRDRYIADHPSLAGRVMFTDSEPGTPEAAFIKSNDPSDIVAIQDLVS